jgi:octaprenyl-diphosphate synthase
MQMGNADLNTSDYFQVISDKTACLFAASARLGGVIAERPAALCRSLEQFGLLLGQAFQIADDVLDYRANDEELGKSLGDDLAEGKVTLPLILAMERAGTDEREQMRGMIKQGGSSRHLEVRDVMNRTGALDEAMEQARGLVARAKNCLSSLPDNPEREALAILADYAVDRSL